MKNLLVVLLVLTLVVAACGTQRSDTRTTPEEGQAGGVGEGLVVVATVFPLAWLASTVAPGADVTFLGGNGQDPHDHELSPAAREALETAEVLLYMGDLDFQPQVESAAASATGQVVDVAAVAGAHRLLDVDPDGGGDPDEAAVDPHVWFDPSVMADVARRVGEAFAAADAEHARDYAANADAAAQELTDLNAQIDRLLADCRFDTVIVSHEAYAYLLGPRGLEQEGISGAGGHVEASPGRLAQLTQRIRDEGIPAIAAEPLEGRADAEVLAQESGAPLVEIDPLEVADDDALERGYPQMLTEQVESFATALDCAAPSEAS